MHQDGVFWPLRLLVSPAQEVPLYAGTSVMAARFRSLTTSAADARRRRLFLLRGHSDSPVEDTAGDGREAVLSSRVPVPLPSLKPALENEADFDRSFSRDTAETAHSIPGLLASQFPVSWLFVGDSFTPGNTHEPRPWRVFTTRFSGAIRAHFHRSKDVFIDATFAGARLSEVLFDFERRISKFEPDICFLSLSLKEGDSKSVERFERMLVRLIRWSKKFDCQLVIQTPPCLPSRSDAELTRRLILVESIRGITAEHGVPLVDHWAHWEGAAYPGSGADRWIDPESETPDEQGHRQLAQRLIDDLRLKDVAVPDPANSNVPATSTQDHLRAP